MGFLGPVSRCVVRIPLRAGQYAQVRGGSHLAKAFARELGHRPGNGVCVDRQDHVFIVNRNDMTDKEAEISRQAPLFIEFDADGKAVNGFGDWRTVPNTTHDCTIDY